MLYLNWSLQWVFCGENWDYDGNASVLYSGLAYNDEGCPVMSGLTYASATKVSGEIDGSWQDGDNVFPAAVSEVR